MGTQIFTIYFRNFPEGYYENELRNVFKVYGDIVKLFIHHSRTYGMVEYNNIGSCHKAIESLHNKLPYKMHVSIAKNSTKYNNKHDNKDRESDEFSISSSTKMSDSNRNVNNNMTSLKEDDVYMYVDIHNKKIGDMLMDDAGRLYVPLDRCTGVRRIYKRRGNMDINDYYKNSQNYVVEELFPINTSGESIDLSDMSVVSNGSDRRMNQKINRNPTPKSLNKNRDKKPQVKDENDENWSDNKSTNNSKPELQKPRIKSPKSSPTPSNIPEVAERKFKSIKSPDKPKRTSSAESISSSIKQIRNLKPKLFIPNCELPRNKVVAVSVTYRIDDNTAVVNISKHINQLEKIFQLCEGKEFEVLSDFEAGDYGLTVMANVWCRIRILEKTPKVFIHFIDLGYKQTIESPLYKMPQYIADIPALGILIQTVEESPPITELTNEISVKVIGDIPGGFKVKVTDNLTENQDAASEKAVSEHNTQNSITTQDSTKPVPKKKHYVNKLFTELNDEIIGYITPVTFLSSEKFVASFLPRSHLSDLNVLAEMRNKCKPDKSFSPQVGEIVAGKHPSEGWNRAIFLGKRNNQYKLAFIDYGAEAFVDEIREVLDVYKDIPWFSCICTVSTELAQKIKKLIGNGFEVDNMEFTIKSVRTNSATILITKDEVLGEGNVEPWDPTVSVKEDEPEAVTELCNSDRIKLVHESDGYLFVRTPYCDNLLKRIKDLFNKNISRFPYLKIAPKKGDLVAAMFEDEWYRAVVNSVNNDKATILYVDYGNEEEMPWRKLRELNNDLKEIQYTVFKIKLKGYNGKFTDKALQYLTDLQENNNILTVTFDKSVDDGVQLITKSGASILDVLLSLDQPSKVSIPPKLPLLQVLSKYQNKPHVVANNRFRVPGKNDKRIMGDDFVLQEVTFGKQTIRILALINSRIGLFSFCLNKEDQINEINGRLRDDLQYYADNLSPFDPTYKPEVGEVVLAKTDDEVWKRALVSEINDYEYEVFLIDYGLTPSIKIKDIRRISPDLIKLEAIANIGLIDGITTNDYVQDVTEKILQPGKIFDVNVKSKDDTEMYNVEIPLITKELQKFN